MFVSIVAGALATYQALASGALHALLTQHTFITPVPPTFLNRMLKNPAVPAHALRTINNENVSENKEQIFSDGLHTSSLSQSDRKSLWQEKGFRVSESPIPKIYPKYGAKAERILSTLRKLMFSLYKQSGWNWIYYLKTFFVYTKGFRAWLVLVEITAEQSDSR